MPDSYKAAADYATKLEAAMRRAKMWPGDKPEGTIEVQGPFGGRNMAFEQWLAWVLIPRVQQLVAERGTFPPSSAVAAYAAREFDTVPDSDEVLKVLRGFDRFIEESARK